MSLSFQKPVLLCNCSTPKIHLLKLCKGCTYTHWCFHCMLKGKLTNPIRMKKIRGGRGGGEGIYAIISKKICTGGLRAKPKSLELGPLDNTSRSIFHYCFIILDNSLNLCLYWPLKRYNSSISFHFNPVLSSLLVLRPISKISNHRKSVGPALQVLDDVIPQVKC